MGRNIFLPFYPSARVNYFIIFALFSIADFNQTTKAYDTIVYSSINSLSERLGNSISVSTLRRVLSANNQDYALFLSCDKGIKTITLNAHHTRERAKEEPFIIITERELQIMKSQNYNNLFCRYLLYTKYYCGCSGASGTDFTADQFLSACGLSQKSNSHKEQISAINKYLKENKVVRIDKYRDILGHTRNKYFYLLR